MIVVFLVVVDLSTKCEPYMQNTSAYRAGSDSVSSIFFPFVRSRFKLEFVAPLIGNLPPQRAYQHWLVVAYPVGLLAVSA